MLDSCDKPDKYLLFFLERAISTISINYYGKLDYERMYIGALKGIVESLDPFSNVIIQEKSRVFQGKNTEKSLCYTVNGKVGIIKISHFCETTAEELHYAIVNLRKNEITQVIIDLRGNWGGSVDALVAVCNLLVKASPLFLVKIN